MLVSTGDVRSWIKIPDAQLESNAKLLMLIQAVEAFVDNWTNRKLECKHYNTHPDYCYLDGSGTRWIYLPQYPVSWIGEVYVDGEREFGSGTAIGSDDLVVYWQEGKLYSEGDIFLPGHRNIKVEYIAGYGSDAGAVIASTYDTPFDLKQVIIEMVTQTFKEGLTSVHTVEAGENTKFIQMLSKNSFWRNVLNEYKNYAAGLMGRWE